MDKQITKTVTYIGVDDTDIDLFESQYAVPDGMCYNSYLVEGEKLAVMDTVDVRKADEWLANLKTALAGRTPDYLVVHHMEPDHSGSIAKAVEQFPNIKIVCSAMAKTFLGQFFADVDFSANVQVVKEGDELDLGGRKLTFYAAPMVHWPEVLVSYDSQDGVLFSADGFGKFGTIDADADDWACEARRYYFNICGKYGPQVQTLLKKVGPLAPKVVCPLHGPVLTGEALSEALSLYDTWSKYEVETPGVLVAHASIHGGTAAAAEKIAEMLREKGVGKVAVTDLCRDDMAEAIEDAFRMGTLVVAAASYDADLFPPMYEFLHKLQLKGYRNRRVAIVENGTWSPTAGRVMKSMLQSMKDIEIIEPMVTIRSRMKDSDLEAFKALVDKI